MMMVHLARGDMRGPSFLLDESCTCICVYVYDTLDILYRVCICFGFVSVSCVSCFNMDHRSLRPSGPENLLCLDSVAELA